MLVRVCDEGDCDETILRGRLVRYMSCSTDECTEEFLFISKGLDSSYKSCMFLGMDDSACGIVTISLFTRRIMALVRLLLNYIYMWEKFWKLFRDLQCLGFDETFDYDDVFEENFHIRR